MISQTVLPFKLAVTNESLTAHAGLALFGEYYAAMGIGHLMDHALPEPGSAIGYKPAAFVAPLILTLHGGGRTLEDVREIRNDTGFGMEYMPCGTFAANAAFFALGVLAHNLFIGFRRVVSGGCCTSLQVQTLRWRLYQTAGKGRAP